MLVELSVLDLLAAAAAALVLLWVLARPRRGLFLWSLALLPILVVYIANPENRIFSYHGFLHLSIVNLILEDGLPPANPVLAGETLRYQWWFLDANGSPCGSESNTSNGYSIAWVP